MLAAVQPAARVSGEPASEPSQAGPVEAGATIRYLGHNAGSAELTRRRSMVEMSGCSRRTKWRGVAAMRRGLRQRSMLGHLHKPDAPRRRAMAAWAAGALAGALAAVVWMHMRKADVKHSTSSVNCGGYVPGDFPDNVKNIQAVGSDEVQMTIIGPYSKRWFTYNELSQVTPMPLAWDTTGSGHKSD